MKVHTLFQFGAVAAMVTALGDAVGNLIYFAGKAQTLFFAWFFIVITVINVFALIALFAAQANREEIFTFFGFVVLLTALIFFLIDSERRLGLQTGLLTQAQVDQGLQNISFLVALAIRDWGFFLGAILFGIGIVRAGTFPRWAGISFILLGVINQISNLPGLGAIFILTAIFQSLSWGWAGWTLWKILSAHKSGIDRMQPPEAVPQR